MMGNARSCFNPPEYRMIDDPSKMPAESDHADSGSTESGEDTPRKLLSQAAQRALAEAEARRQEYRQKEAALPREIGGRGGKEPGRYGDWEIKGLTSDF
jgi:hypothetical protein